MRDFDAHSWVEVYYPGWGWITFDPTPADSPARSQPADAASVRRRRQRQRLDQLRRRPAVRARRRRRRRAAEPAPWWRIPAIVAGALALVGLGLLGAAPLAARRAAGAVGARARAAAHAPRAGARDDAARARAALRRHARRGRLRARAAREPLPRRAEPPDPRPAPRPAVRARTRRRHSGPDSRLVGPPARGNRGPTIGRMDDVYDLYQRGMALLEDGHFHQATIPLAKARDLEPDKTSIREALGPGVLPLRRLRGGARGVRGGGRTRARPTTTRCSASAAR